MTEMEKNLIERLAALLQDSARLGLTFSRGSAYISASYIEEQKSLKKDIQSALDAVDRLLGPPKV